MPPVPCPSSLADCERADRSDPLAAFRDAFALPEGVVYLNGNSLGAPPRAAAARLREVVEEEWGRHLVAGWTECGWLDLPTTVGDKLAELVGAREGEILVTDTTTVNLFKCIVSALDLHPDRATVVVGTGEFPTDRYVAQGVAEGSGRDLELRIVDAAEIHGALDETVALVVLSHVDFRTARIRDMAGISAAARAAGALTLWDLSHSVGVVPVELARAGADLAVGCGYKYLSGGPGAPAFLFVRSGLQEALRPAIQGWLGHADPFAFELSYRPAAGIRRHLPGTPGVLGLASLEIGVDLVRRAGVAAIREKSMALTSAFAALAEQRLSRYGVTLVGPSEAAERGSQVSLTFRDAYPLSRALRDRGVVVDFRAPDVLRCGLAPLYTRHVDVWSAIESIASVLEARAHERPEFRAPSPVT